MDALARHDQDATPAPTANLSYYWYALELVAALAFCSLRIVRRVSMGLVDDFFSNGYEFVTLFLSVCTVVAFLVSLRPAKVYVSKAVTLALLLSVVPAFFGMQIEGFLSDRTIYMAWAIRCFYDLAYLWALFSLGRNIGIFPGLRKISTGGCYRFLRHPIYSIYVHSQLMMVLLDPRPEQFAIFFCLAAGLIVRMYAEERVLSDSDAFRDYREKVRYRLFHPLFSAPVLVFACVLLWEKFVQ